MKLTLKEFFPLGFCMQAILLPIAHAATLIQPAQTVSANGQLDITLSIQYGTWSQDDDSGFSLVNTRLFDGLLPGKTIVIEPGDTVKILYKNDLELQDSAKQDEVLYNNEYHIPDHSNIHFHGGHVSGELPSDDVTYKVEPKDQYQYTTVFPANHMGGTHWIHPHVHGSSTLQVGGGAACALIVNDPTGFLPTDVAGATGVVLMVQEMNPEQLQYAIDESRDEKTKINIGTFAEKSKWFVVNGQYQPTYNMNTNQWYRFRFLHSGYLGLPLDLMIPSVSCEMQLLAKDGIYIRDFPRTITEAPIPAGGRADIMVRCTVTGTFLLTQNAKKDTAQTLMSLVVTEGGIAAADLAPWIPVYPAYLQDLRFKTVTDGCSCATGFSKKDTASYDFDDTITYKTFSINDQFFNVSNYLHTVPFGSIAERTLTQIDRHPYHHHVYPFQITTTDVATSVAEQAYFKAGDFHDVIQLYDVFDRFEKIDDIAYVSSGSLTIRFKADVHLGKMMLHCHILTHEDYGTMSQELIAPASASCSCSPLTITNSPTPVPPLTTAAPTTNSPTPVPTPVVTTCFSSMSTVIEEKDGEMKLKDLVVGQKVLTGSGCFEPIYTIDHKNPRKRTEFVQIYHEDNNGSNMPLELTGSHMVFLLGEEEPIPASLIQIGDKLESLYAMNGTGGAVVTEILSVHRDGIWNPITPSGTMVVDGIVASTYSVMADMSKKKTGRGEEIDKLNIYVGACKLPTSHHRFMHLLMYPYRSMCLSVSLSLCDGTKEYQDSEFTERNLYSFVGLSILNLYLACNSLVKDIMILVLYLSFSFLEFCTTIHLKAVIVAIVGVYFYSSFFAVNNKKLESKRNYIDEDTNN